MGVVAFLAAALLAATTSSAQSPRGGTVELRAERLAGGFAAPVFLTEPDDGSGRRFVVDQVGRIRIVSADGDVRDEPFLDVSDQLVELNTDYDERGLLGLAFHPEFRDNGRFFVYYSAPRRDEAPSSWDHTSHLSEFRVSDDDPDRADPESERVVMYVDEPFGNHNGGHILFGRDGHLYVPLGDGGNGGDVDPDDDDRGRPARGNAQTLSNVLGKVLRIDVDGERPYAIPEDNPFAREGPDDVSEEIWAYGLRNPYGLSLDLDTGDLYVSDAGQALYEEVNRIPAGEGGRNYGWNIREGTHCFNPDDFTEPPEDCRDTGYRGEPLVPPVVEYGRSPEAGSVVVPGVRYRGDEIPELEGRLLFGDYSRVRFRPDGVLYVAEPRGDDELWRMGDVRIANALDGGRADGDLNRFLLGVAQDLDGDVYALTTREGGPTGQTGQILAFRSAAEDESGMAWWWWVVIGAGVLAAALAALVGVARVRRRGGAA